MGYMTAYGPCFVCKRSFHFNPDRVPSYDPSFDNPAARPGREPICESCITLVNEKRRENGLPEWPVHPDAYEPQEVA